MKKRKLIIFITSILIFNHFAGAFAIEDNLIKKTAEKNLYLTEIQELEETYIDRFIIYYKSASSQTQLTLSENDVVSDTSFNFLSEKTEQAFSKAIEEKYEKFRILDKDNIISTPENIQKNFKKQKESTKINNWKSGKAIVMLNEKIDPDIFISELSSDENIEYIQPDYELKFASDNTLETSGNYTKSTEENLIPSDEAVLPSIVEKTDIPSAASDSSLPSSDEITKTPASENLKEISSSDSENKDNTVKISSSEEILIETDEMPPHLPRPIVALIDGGVDITHEALSEKITNPWDFVNNSELVYVSSISDQYYHGTHVAGIIAQTAPSAAIMPLKVFEQGSAYTSDIIDAIEYAEEHGALIVNCSWGSTDDNQALKEAIENSEMLFVCAAGNNRNNLAETPIYPACFDLDNIISVTSVNNDSGLSYFSNYGNIDIAACGRNIQSAWPENQYGKMNGTSMSAGFISGAAAIANGENIYEIRQNIMDTADRIEHLRNYIDGGKMLNINNLKKNIRDSGYIEIDYAEDFNLEAYNRTPSENWKLFNSLENIQVTVSDSHTMVLKSNGSVWTWGGNFYGELGFDKKQSGFPIQIPSLNNIISISAGDGHCIALKEDGVVYTWGYNNRGQLGNGNTTNSNIPTQVLGLNNIKAIAAGSLHSMALKNDGTLYSWGSNASGVLGDGTIVHKSIPVQVLNLPNAKAMDGGESHSLAVLENGDVYAWGHNTRGQLGNGNLTDQLTPVKVETLSDINKVSCGYAHSAALKNDGSVFTWGRGLNGALGTGNTDNKKTPVQINNIEGVIDICAGIACTVAVKENGTVYMSGTTQNATTSDHCEFELMTGFENVKTLDLHDKHIAALSNNGDVYTWGSNRYGQIGDGVNIPQLTARKVQELNNIIEVSAASNNTFALKENGTVYSWGSSEWGLLGRESETTAVPGIIPELENIISVKAGHYHCLALKSDGTVYSWGNDTFKNYSAPALVPELSNISAISSGYNYSLALKEDGSVWAWGENASGQLGDGTKNQSSVPIQVVGLTNIIAISAGACHNLALKSDGSVYSWGSNYYYQLGDGTKNEHLTPVKINSLNNIVEISAGESHSLALKSDGSVYSWGENTYGELGNGNHYTRTYPIAIDAISDVKEIAAGRYFSLAVKEDGSVWAWGTNYQYAQLGDGTLINRSLPVQVPGLENIQDVATGYYHAMALSENGDVYAWGNNQNGQIGDEHVINRSIPYCVSIDDNQEGVDFEHAIELTESTTKQGYIIESNQSVWFYFIPKNDNTYKINLTTGFSVTAYDENLNELTMTSSQIFLSYPGRVYFKVDKISSEGSDFVIFIAAENPIGNSNAFALAIGSYQYYSNLSDGGKLYKNDSAITTEPVRWICKSGNTIYYAKADSVCKLSDEDEEVEVISNIGAYFLTADANKLYFANWSDGGKIYSYDLQTQELDKMCDDAGRWLEKSDGYLYYYNSLDNSSRYRILLTASGLTTGEKL